MESIWRKETPEILPRQNEAGNGHFDVIVIGAGMAGLLIAYYLQKAGKKVLVLEASRIGSGQTERTTAKITSQHGLKYSTLISTVGIEKARLYAGANEEAINEYERLIDEMHIDCDFSRLSSVLYYCYDKELIEDETKAAKLCGLKAEFTDKAEIPLEIKGAVEFSNQAQFSPLKFVKAIAKELTILEHTKVTEIKDRVVITRNGAYLADNIVIATHYPILNIPGLYFMRQHQERSSVLALYGCDKLSSMYYGIDRRGLSFRQSGDFLLLGGGAHRTGRAGGVYEFLSKRAKQLYPDSKEVARWSAQDCMPHDGIPFIGRYSLFRPHIFVATGFQKWGMTSSMISALLIRDAICRIPNQYLSVFTPQRINLRASLPKLAMDVGISTMGIIKGFLHYPDKTSASIPPGSGDIVRIGGVRYACYKDEDGILHTISARCPHLGCELEWNDDEHSWDCPCHGSRFDIEGNLMENPSVKNNRH